MSRYDYEPFSVKIATNLVIALISVSAVSFCGYNTHHSNTERDEDIAESIRLSNNSVAFIGSLNSETDSANGVHIFDSNDSDPDSNRTVYLSDIFSEHGCVMRIKNMAEALKTDVTGQCINSKNLDSVFADANSLIVTCGINKKWPASYAKRTAALFDPVVCHKVLDEPMNISAAEEYTYANLPEARVA